MTERNPSLEDAARQLAGAAHDLRQPLDALAIYVQLPGSDPQLAVELAPKMARASASAQALARSLQDMAAQRVASMHRAPVAVPTLLADLAAIYEPLAEHKGLQWRMRAAIGDATLLTDGSLLRRLLGNLLANAIVHTRRGGVLLAARRYGGRTVFEVWDTGCGIAPADQAKIFEPFVQLDPAGEGEGLGLAVVRELAERLGGAVSVQSRPGRGSVFRLALTG